MKVFLPDNKTVELPEDAKGQLLAKEIKKDLNGNAPLAVKVNGILKDLTTSLRDQDKVEIITFESREGKDIFWHSSAHILAQAVMRLFPNAQPTIGPAIETGFYYDFANLEISEEDFTKIDDEVKKIVKERLQPTRIEYTTKEEALEIYKDNPFKIEMIEQLEEGLSAYQQGEFIDLCRGPHLPNLSLVQSFKVMKTSGAYWRADHEKEQLTRIYAVSYPDKKQLKTYLQYLEEVKKRDHRLIGKKLELFSFHEEAAGMPFFKPKGMIVWDELMNYWNEIHKEKNYQFIKTPTMMSRDLWETSGHWENYRENMYTSHIDDRDYAIKPMNCPGCMLFYKEGQYSYRQFPLKIAEVGNVHRHELSGALSGLFRVRCFHQDDSHIFMTPEQVTDEVIEVLEIADTIYSQFGLEYHLELSTKPKKAIGSDEVWEMSTESLRLALEKSGKKFIVNEGDGAFYGPKIDFHIKDAIGRTWQCGTIQLDMNLPERFDLTYTDIDGNKQRPIMLHRAIFGSVERFFGILVENYSGRFPLWFNPVHVRVLPIADRHHEYARKIEREIRSWGLRVEVDDATESVSKKVRNAQLSQVNYIFVVGDQELESEMVNVRTRMNEVLGAKKLSDLKENLMNEYSKRLPQSTLI